MSTKEVEPVVAEEPATHKKQAQRWLILVGVCIVAAMFISVAIKAGKSSSNAQAKKANEPPPSAEVVKTASSEDDFNKRLQQEQQRQRLAEADAATAQNRDELIDRLEKARDEQLAKAGTTRPQPDDGNKTLIEQQLSRLGEGRTSSGDGVNSLALEWQKRELIRTFDARRSGLQVQLIGANAPAGATRALTTAATAGSANSTSPLRNVEREQQNIQAEIARVERIRQELESGRLSPERAASSLIASTGNAPAGSNTEPDRRGQTIGQTAANAKVRKPGEVLVPLGTVGRAALDQDVISDFPGPWRGMIIDDIYDVSNRYIVIPKGSRLVGEAVRSTNVNEPINNRMGLLINWIVLPDGSKISLDRSAALDVAGVAAIKDKVNRHLVAQVLGVGAFALLSSETSRGSSAALQQTSFSGDVGESLREQFAPLAEKYLSLVPTITLRSGTPLRIFIVDEIFAQPWSTVNEDLVRNASR
jgi:type IV secretion system protein TrbI